MNKAVAIESVRELLGLVEKSLREDDVTGAAAACAGAYSILEGLADKPKLEKMLKLAHREAERLRRGTQKEPHGR